MKCAHRRRSLIILWYRQKRKKYEERHHGSSKWDKTSVKNVLFRPLGPVPTSLNFSLITVVFLVANLKHVEVPTIAPFGAITFAPCVGVLRGNFRCVPVPVPLRRSRRLVSLVLVLRPATFVVVGALVPVSAPAGNGVLLAQVHVQLRALDLRRFSRMKFVVSFSPVYPPITYYWTVYLILDHSYLVGKLTSSKIADT
jgi:hypothetical protein